jgi:amino acid adenylation domain-containing protein
LNTSLLLLVKSFRRKYVAHNSLSGFCCVATPKSFLMNPDCETISAGTRTSPASCPLPAFPRGGSADDPVRVVDPDVTGVEFVEPVVPGPDDRAYIVYTSGTTGWPKGVDEVSYRNLGTLLDALATIDLRPGGMGINAVSPAFDGWLWCTLVYLLHGQGVALVDFASADGSRDPADLVEEHKPTTVCLTPTLLAALGRIPVADVIMVAGEPCPPALMAQLADTSRVLNVYGPTEATVACTWADTARGDDPTTIGRPIPEYEIHVLDEHGRPVEDGAAGELYIGGPAVSLGYRNQPDLTRERFLPDPFVGGDARMYRTGDLASARPDGQLEFRGRNDEQVKIRGFRVELRELELVALDLDCVRSAAAFTVTTGDSLGLAVTTVPGTDPAECVECIRARGHAADLHEAVDRRRGRKAARPGDGQGGPGGTGPGLEGHDRRQGPGTDRERHVCEVWSELLSRPVDGVDANFFEVGGHSLLAAKAVGVLRRATGLPLSVGHLLADPTPAGWPGGSTSWPTPRRATADGRIVADDLARSSGRTAGAAVPAPGHPMVVFGHSFGALLGYEVTKELVRRGVTTPQALVVAACRPPEHWEGSGLRLADDDDEDLERLLNVLRRGARLSASYDPRGRREVDCPLGSWGGEEDETVLPEHVAGWRPYAAGEFRRRLFPGGTTSAWRTTPPRWRCCG